MQGGDDEDEAKEASARYYLKGIREIKYISL